MHIYLLWQEFLNGINGKIYNCHYSCILFHLLNWLSILRKYFPHDANKTNYQDSDTFLLLKLILWFNNFILVYKLLWLLSLYLFKSPSRPINSISNCYQIISQVHHFGLLIWDSPKYAVNIFYFHCIIKKLFWPITGQNIAQQEIQAEIEKERRHVQTDAM